MSRPLRIAYPGAFYHVTSRGNEQKVIYKTQRDREKFLFYLESATERYGAVIHAYCLMSSHYHILMETTEGNLSQIMRHINGAYTNYFNTKRKRAGHLFQGRYKAILVEKDAYALELSRYIHLNPVRAGMVKRPEEYPWSSYRCFIGLSTQSKWLRKESHLAYFQGDENEKHEKYRRFVEDAMERNMESPLSGSIGGAVLGTREFIAIIENRHFDGKRAERDVPAVRKISCRWSVGAIIEAVRCAIGKEERLAKKASMYLCRRYSGAQLKEIGLLFGVGPSGVSQESRRFAMKMKEDEELQRIISGILERMRCVNVQT